MHFLVLKDEKIKETYLINIKIFLDNKIISINYNKKNFSNKVTK
jgi:hypothetical protein